MKKTREFHDNKRENISGESIGGAELIRGRRYLIFFFLMRRLFEGGAYSNKYGTPASECIECSEKFLFLYEIFQIDSNNQTC